MRVLITGATGLLGSYVVNNILTNGNHSVVIYTTNKKRASGIFKQHRLSIITFDEFKTYNLDLIDIVLNCAYPMNRKGKELSEGIDFIEDLLKRVSKSNVKGFINISSQSVYGNKRLNASKEADVCMPENMYALGKMLVEKLVDAYLCDVPYINVRLASLLAPSLDDRFVNKFVKSVISGNTISIAKGSQHIQFLDVRDAADALCRILDRWDFSFSGIINLGGAENYSLREYAEMVNRVACLYGIPPVDIIENELIDDKNTMMDSSKMVDIFQWTPSYKIENTVMSIFEKTFL